MEENRAFVTRDGRVIRIQAGEVGPRPQQRPPDAEERVRAYVDQGQHRPARDGLRAPVRSRGINMPKLAAVMLLMTVCVLVIILAFAGVKGTGKQLLSKKKITGVITDKSSQMNTKPVVIQKPTSVQPRSYPKTRSQVAKVSHENRWIQKSEAQVYEHESQKQEAPPVSREPVVDYRASIKEMKSVIDAQSTEINRITDELHNIGGSD